MPKKDKIAFEDKQRRIGKRTGIGHRQCENKRCKRDAIYFVTLKQDLPTLPFECM